MTFLSKFQKVVFSSSSSCARALFGATAARTASPNAPVKTRRHACFVQPEVIIAEHLKGGTIAFRTSQNDRKPRLMLGIGALLRRCRPAGIHTRVRPRRQRWRRRQS